jgi:hypothetical protein
MDPLKQYIEGNRHLFDDEEPAPGHFERFEQKMNARPVKRASMSPWHLAAAAASIAAIFTVSIMLMYLSSNDPITVCTKSGDMKYCFQTKMNEVVMEIYALSNDLNPFVKNDVQFEVQSIIDANSSFDQELPEGLSKKQARIILSEYYAQNLEILQGIVQTLKKLE